MEYNEISVGQDFTGWSVRSFYVVFRVSCGQVRDLVKIFDEKGLATVFLQNQPDPLSYVCHPQMGITDGKKVAFFSSGTLVPVPTREEMVELKTMLRRRVMNKLSREELCLLMEKDPGEEALVTFSETGLKNPGPS